MRRVVAFLSVLALAAPFAASGSVHVAGDGTLSVRDLEGLPNGISVSIRATGAVIGRCDQCSFRLEDLTMNDAGVPVVTGAERERDIDKDGEVEFYSGRDVRWKVLGGRYWLKIRQARDVDLSVVGRGTVLRLRGTAGTYSVNDGADKNVLPTSEPFFLSAPTTPAR
jgi:hypothetical protein